MDSTSSIAAMALTKIGSNVIDDLYNLLKSKAVQPINKRNVIRKLPTLSSRMHSVRFIKTLWQFETAVDVESFYCSPHIIFPTTKGRKSAIRKRIDTISLFGKKRNILIRGIAGQGKSILLRHLCIKEFELGERIPIFIEFRRIQKNESLFNHISSFLDILDLPIDETLFKILLQSGKFIFFLDGFDEIWEEQQLKILSELEYLSSVSQNSQFIITSRPNISIEMSSCFDVFTLDDLKGDEYKTVIRKLASSRNYANLLIKEISSNEANITELLCNPLMVTLLIILYKSYQVIPDKLTDFYDSLFQVLLSRHDGTKPGFKRERRCLINDKQYREIFDSVCFEAGKIIQYIFDYSTIYGLVGKSTGLLDINVDPDKYLRDIVEVTCLILKEGEEYRFIHNSVQEYFAASFIRNRPDISVRKFYLACLNNYNTYINWMQEIEYLSEIDRYRYIKHYFIPLSMKFLNVNDDIELINGPPRLNSELVCHLIKYIDIGLDTNQGNGMWSVSLPFLSQILPEHGEIIVDDIFNLDFSDVAIKVESGEIIIDTNLLLFKIDTEAEQREISCLQIYNEGFLVEQLYSITQKIVNYIYPRWKEAFDYISREDVDITAELDI